MKPSFKKFFYSSEITELNESLKPEHSVESLAKHHKTSVDVVNNKLEKGTKVEMEHTKDRNTARTIASHHIYEDLDYYEKLKKVEG